MLMSTPGAGHNQSTGRWIAIDVGMLDHPVVGWKQPMKPADPKKKAASKCEAWIDLIRFARWKAGASDNQGRIVYVERGELMASRSFLAQRWNWTEKAVRHFMQRLEQEFMVTKTEPRLVAGSEPGSKRGQPEGHRNGTPNGQRRGQQSRNLNQHYRIENYDLYQTIREMDDLLRGQQEGTSSDQLMDQHRGQRGASEGPESIPSSYQGDTKGESPNGLFGSNEPAPAAPKRDLEVDQAFEAYQQLAERLSLSRPRKPDSAKRKTIRARIKEAGGLDGWMEVLRKIENSAFLRGDKTDFQISFPWLLKKSNFDKILDGAFDNNGRRSGGGDKYSDRYAGVE
jgi:hypothetical protein